MALETLRGVTEINGEPVRTVNEDMGIPIPNYLSGQGPIVIDHSINMIAFKIQNGPIKEVGKNGCQVTDMIAVAKHIIEKLNEKFPCYENEATLTHLKESLKWQVARTAKREARGVEGTSQN